MRTMFFLLVMAALAAPVVALAEAAPTPASTANQLCQQSKTTLGAESCAGTTYGTNANKSNAFGKCVSPERQERAERGRQRLQGVHGRADRRSCGVRQEVREQRQAGLGGRGQERVREVRLDYDARLGRRRRRGCAISREVVKGRPQEGSSGLRNLVRQGSKRIRQVRLRPRQDQIASRLSLDDKGRRDPPLVMPPPRRSNPSRAGGFTRARPGRHRTRR